MNSNSINVKTPKAFASDIIHLGIEFVKSQPVLIIALIAMFITCCYVPVDSTYLTYFNFRTLATLFCTLAVVSAFSHIHTFEIISREIIIRLHNLRNAVTALVLITFIGSMLLANDMALLTFLPLGYYVLSATGNFSIMAYTFILQNIAANLGGMVTPFGNPQNLYLYSYYNIATGQFIKIMLPAFIASMLIIFILCRLVKRIPLTLKKDINYKVDKRKTIIYSLLFIFSLLIVFRVISYIVGTLVVIALLLFFDRKSIAEVNYPLLATFCVFFIFSGNMARIPEISNIFSRLIPKSPLILGIISCQFISNVPSAVLLSHFTKDYFSLLPAVNIGGLGTLIASLASLITFSEFRKHNKNQTKHYITMFSLINFSLIVFLVLLQIVVLKLST